MNRTCNLANKTIFLSEDTCCLGTFLVFDKGTFLSDRTLLSKTKKKIEWITHGQKKTTKTCVLRPKSKIIKRVLLSMMADGRFPTFQKKNLLIKPGKGNNVLVYHFFGFYEIKKFYS